MSTYVISDIHGCYTEFQQLLKQIGFKDTDELIIAGDIVDRGTESYEMLRYMESCPHNVEFIIGNHDYDFMKYCSNLAIMSNHHYYDGSLTDLIEQPHIFHQYIYDHYGTVRQLIKDYNPTIEDFKTWRDIFYTMPYYIQKDINGKKYTIVHAGYISPQRYNKTSMELRMFEGIRSIEMFYLWARETHYDFGGLWSGTIIFGHTPTISSGIYYNNGKVLIKYNPRNRCRFIDIDCGFVFKKYYPDANMAIFRLDDEKVFYLEL